MNIDFFGEPEYSKLNLPSEFNNEAIFFSYFEDLYNETLNNPPVDLGLVLRDKNKEIDLYRNTLQLEGLPPFEIQDTARRLIECQNEVITRVIKYLFEGKLTVSAAHFEIILERVEDLGFIFGKNSSRKERIIGPEVHKKKYFQKMRDWFQELYADVVDPEDQIDNDNDEVVVVEEMEIPVSEINHYDARDFALKMGEGTLGSIIKTVTNRTQLKLPVEKIMPSFAKLKKVQLMSAASTLLSQRRIYLSFFDKDGNVNEIEAMEVGEQRDCLAIDAALSDFQFSVQMFIAVALDINLAEAEAYIDMMNIGLTLDSEEIQWLMSTFEYYGINLIPEEKYTMTDETEFRKYLRLMRIESILEYELPDIIEILRELKFEDYQDELLFMTEDADEVDFSLLKLGLMRYSCFRLFRFVDQGHFTSPFWLYTYDEGDEDEGGGELIEV